MTKNSFLYFAVVILFVSFSFTQIRGTEINKTYPKKEYVKLKAALGSCKVIKSSDGKIHVRLIYSFKDNEFRPHFTETEDELDLEEEFKVKNPDGKSEWIISIPGETKIDFKSGTGSFSAEDVKAGCKVETGTGSVSLENGSGKFKISSGTGSIRFTNMSGDFDASSGTGSLKVDNSKGVFKLSSGTGSLDVRNIDTEGSSKFNSGTGSVYVSLSSSPDKDLTIGSGTGNAVLNYNGNPLKGRFVFKAEIGHGNITSPVKFQKEETVSEGHNQYDLKSFRIDSEDSPVIRIQSGTGAAKLIK